MGVDPALGALQDNGGPTRTMRPSASGPAADAIPVGTTFTVPSPLTTFVACAREDQRGVPGPVAGASGCAIGAVEPADRVDLDQSPLLVSSTSATFGSPLTLSTSGGSGKGAVSFSAADGTATGCTVSGSPAALSATTPGTCVVTATKAAAGVYRATSSAPTDVTFARLAQAPLALVVANGTAGVPVSLRTTGGSGSGAVSYAVVGGSASGCAMSDSGSARLLARSSGTCVVVASKEGDALYAPTSSGSVTVRFAAPVTAPGPGQGLTVAGRTTAKQRVVTWRAPASTGGAAVTSYRVSVLKSARSLYAASVTGTRLTLRTARLARGTLTLRVVAVNRVGAGRAATVTFRVR